MRRQRLVSNCWAKVTANGLRITALNSLGRRFLILRLGALVFLRLSLIALLLSVCAFAQEITVAAASDLSTALPEIVAAYTKESGRSVKLIFGSSGNLSTQIENGAPFDIFFSADESYPAHLIEKGLADKATLYRYAIGELVLWVPSVVPVDVQKLGINALLDPAVKKVAIANPAHAPYGRAAEAALKKLNVYDQ